MSGAKIIEGLKEAVAGNFGRVTIEGQAWVREDAAKDREIARLREALTVFCAYHPFSISAENGAWVLRIPDNARQPMFADFDKARAALAQDGRE